MRAVEGRRGMAALVFAVGLLGSACTSDPPGEGAPPSGGGATSCDVDVLTPNERPRRERPSPDPIIEATSEDRTGGALLSRYPIDQEIQTLRVMTEADPSVVVYSVVDPSGHTLDPVTSGPPVEGGWAQGVLVDIPEPGDWTVRSEATSGGPPPSFSPSIRVLAIPIEHPKPEPAIEVQVDGDTVVFDSAASTDEDGEIVYAYWAFDDGSCSAEGLRVSRRYDRPGTYHASLMVQDDDGVLGFGASEKFTVS